MQASTASRTKASGRLVLTALAWGWWLTSIGAWAPAQQYDPLPAGAAVTDDCPRPGDARDYVRPLTEIAARLPSDDGRLPTDCAGELFGPAEVIESLDVNYLFTWRPTNYFHQPLYFDDQALERYGQSAHPLLQPAISGVHFFSNFTVVPYKMGFNGTHDCVTPVGYHRVGSCAPCISERFPFTWRGALLEAGTACGLVFGLP